MWEFPHPSKKNSQNRRSPPGNNVATAINFLSGVSQGKYTWSNNQGYAVVTSSLPFMSRLDNTDLAAIARRWSECNYRHNELIIAHGDSDRDVFFLLEGRARVTMFSEDGREIAYRDITPGEIFGELAGIDGKARSASVVALEPTRVARLTGAAFRDIVINQPTFAWLLLEHLSAQLRRMTDRVFEFSTLVVRKRLILELLRRAEEIGPLTGQVSISPAPTHFELAAKISTHREAVSREMSALAKKGFIERRGGRLILHDLAVLERLAVKKE
jgi:CRP-like cAMP-binding protein